MKPGSFPEHIIQRLPTGLFLRPDQIIFMVLTLKKIHVKNGKGKKDRMFGNPAIKTDGKNDKNL